MTIHRLNLGVNLIDYHLIAITSLENYRLAYFINQKLSINLSKSKNEIQINIKEGETNFSRFCYSNSDKEISWDLIQNKTVIQYKKGLLKFIFKSNYGSGNKVFEFKK
jgi:hypothetical protein